VPLTLDAAVRARVQACLDAAERPAVALDLAAQIVATNRAASDAGRTSTTTFADLIASHAAEIAGPCADVDRALRALDLDIPSRARSVDGRERVRLVPFADGLVLALSRFGTYMAELDPVVLRSEIHDGLSQDLSALGFAACALHLRLDDLDDPVLVELAARVEALTDTASTTVRALYRHFERGATGGLLDALAAMGAELEEATATQLWIRVDGELLVPRPFGAQWGPAPHVWEHVVAMTRRAIVGLAGAVPPSRAWLGLRPDGGRSRIEVCVDAPTDRLAGDVREHLDAHAESIGGSWTLDRGTIAILV
jgi:hypothetical protein